VFSKNFEEEIIMLNSKKIASLALALTMAVTMAVPAFADDNNSGSTTNTSNSTVMSGSYTQPTISVTVPATGTVAVNPYGLPVKFDKGDGSTVTVKNLQLVSAPMTLKNNGDTALDAYVTASTDVPSTSHVTFFASDPNKDDTAKKTPNIYMQLEAVQSAKSGYGDTLNQSLIEEFADADTWDGVTPIAFDNTGAIGTKTKLVTLKEMDATSGTYQAGSIAQIRLDGQVSEDPETTAWAETDTFTTTIAFTFKTSTASASASTTVVAPPAEETTD
jgi:hypothetical protein